MGEVIKNLEDMLNDYPNLDRDDILAALEFAARLSQIKHAYAIAL